MAQLALQASIASEIYIDQLTSACSGPKRYDYSAEHNAWFYARDGQTLDGLLNQELSTALDGDVLIQLSTQSD